MGVSPNTNHQGYINTCYYLLNINTCYYLFILIIKIKIIVIMMTWIKVLIW